MTARTPKDDTRKKDKQAAKQKSAKQSPLRSPHVLYAAALVGIVFICYTNGLGNDFVFDDHALALKRSRIESLSELVNLSTSYRPLRYLSYALDYAIWGERPFGFHLTNVLIHAGSAVLVFFLARRMTGEPTAAFVAASIFATHPIQTDAVSYISGRRDVLFAVFYIAAFLSYLNYRAGRSRLYFAMFAGFWVTSLMSKEMAVSLPVVIFLWNFSDGWGKQSTPWLKQTWQAASGAFARDRWLYIALFVLGLVYGWYMVFVKNSSGRVTEEGLYYWGGSFFSNALTAIRVQAWYLKQLVLPTPIAQYYGAFDISYSLLDWRALASLAIVASVVVAGFSLLRKNSLMAFAVLSYFAMLLPVSQIIPHHELAADHYLYLPMMSFALLVALVVGAIARRGIRARRRAYGAIAGALITFSAMTMSRNRQWKDDLTLWKANYEAVPNSPRAATNLGGIYAKSDPARAEALFKQALANDPNFELSYLSLARLYVGQKRTAEADEFIEKGLELAHSDAGSRILRNRLLYQSQLITLEAASKWEQGEHQKTEELLLEAVSLYPMNMEPYSSLANLYRPKNHAKEAEVLKQAVSADPSAYDMCARLVSVLFEQKLYSEGRHYLGQLSELSPSRADCRKAAPHLTSAKTAISSLMELRVADETLQALIKQCRD